MKNKIYIVIVQFKLDNNIIANVSSEGYKTFEEAEQFILNRGDNPEKYKDWIYEGDSNIYIIKEVEVK